MDIKFVTFDDTAPPPCREGAFGLHGTVDMPRQDAQRKVREIVTFDDLMSRSHQEGTSLLTRDGRYGIIKKYGMFALTCRTEEQRGDHTAKMPKKRPLALFQGAWGGAPPKAPSNENSAVTTARD